MLARFFTFDLQHKPGAGNRAADAPSRNPACKQALVNQPSEPVLLSAFVGSRGRCQSRWGQAQALLTRGASGGGDVTPSIGDSLNKKAEEIVHTETQLPSRERREMLENGPNTIRECRRLCEETLYSKLLGNLMLKNFS